MCLVELKGSTRLQPACVTRVEEGMEVTTQLRAAAEIPAHDPGTAVCRTQSRLLRVRRQQHVRVAGPGEGARRHPCAFPLSLPQLPVDVSHERFALDHNRCILCTRCVRVCNEIEGAHTWDLLGRGVNSLLISDLHQPWGESDTCTSCGKCVQVCPTGALFDKSKVGGKVRKDPDFLSYLNDMREGLR